MHAKRSLLSRRRPDANARCPNFRQPIVSFSPPPSTFNHCHHQFHFHFINSKQASKQANPLEYIRSPLRHSPSFIPCRQSPSNFSLIIPCVDDSHLHHCTHSSPITTHHHPSPPTIIMARQRQPPQQPPPNGWPSSMVPNAAQQQQQQQQRLAPAPVPTPTPVPISSAGRGVQAPRMFVKSNSSVSRMNKPLAIWLTHDSCQQHQRKLSPTSSSCPISHNSL